MCVCVRVSRSHGCHPRPKEGQPPFCSHHAVCVFSHASPVYSPQIEEVCVDAANKVVTSPAYMKAAHIGEVFDSVGAMVTAVLKLTK